MTAIQLHLIPHQNNLDIPFQQLHIDIETEDQIIEPQDLKELNLPDGIQWNQGIVIEGRAPIWLYGYLIHQCHPAPWVACYDPRLGAVVIATHTHQIKIGQILPMTLS